MILFGGSALHQFQLIVRHCRRLFCLRGAFTLPKQPSLAAIVTMPSEIQSIRYLFDHPAVTWLSDLNVSIHITGHAQSAMKQLDYHNCACGCFCDYSNVNGCSPYRIRCLAVEKLDWSRLFNRWSGALQPTNMKSEGSLADTPCTRTLANMHTVPAQR